MAKKNREKTAPRPILSIAAFCMQVLDGNDGCFSAMRLADHFYVPLPPNYKPGDRVPVPFWALIGFRSRTFTAGELTGKHSLHLVMRNPKGESKPGGDFSIDLPENATSFNYRIQITWRIKTQGLWWMDVFLDGKLYAKMPLRIIFVPNT